VLKESRPGERRVALVPDLVPRLVDAGLEIVVETDAGEHLHADNDAYRAAGARVSSDPLDGAEIVLSVQPPGAFVAGVLEKGCVTVSMLASVQQLPLVRTLQARGVTTFSLDLLPRTSRAQAMDALSSQAMVSGYRSAIVAAERLPRMFPLFMTAAGTVKPATVVVLGAGVAGLQAIATTRRLGAIVEAYDVREAAAEEIRSMGGRFIELPLPPLEGAGGYAREMTEDRAQRQRELLAPHVAKADALITTAGVPGKPAPMLVNRDMVAAMRPGSVVIDLVAELGGNVAGSRPGEEFVRDGVLIWGGRNVPSQMPETASRLYAQNVVNLLQLIVRNGQLTLDFDDDIIAACCVTHEGKVRHQVTGDLLGEVE
jgi:H+-translocating NAD(P) transhydrogenase subunit alpha